MEELVDTVERLLHAETWTLVVRLELANMKYELQLIDKPAFKKHQGMRRKTKGRN